MLFCNIIVFNVLTEYSECRISSVIAELLYNKIWEVWIDASNEFVNNY